MKKLFLAGAAALFLAGCLSSPTVSQRTELIPGVYADLPADLKRNVGYHGIDSEVALFEGRGIQMGLDRGRDGPEIQAQDASRGQFIVSSGQTFERATLAEGTESLPFGVRIVERAPDEISGDGRHSIPPVRISISIYCKVLERCQAVADQIQRSLTLTGDSL